MSQFDVAPTLLGLLHFFYPSLFMEADVMKMPTERGRFFQYAEGEIAHFKPEVGSAFLSDEL
jgi:hypothetical protein